MALYVLLGLAIWLYWPGLNGIFMLDDIPNLQDLKTIQDPRNVEHLVHYVLTGASGKLGRPISLASFLLNDVSWPSHPRAFKYTNVLLHALVGVFVYWLTLKLMRRLGRSRGETAAIAIFTTALWLLHPMQVSTVLYVVQRMTELSALFAVAGLVAYTHGRTTVRTDPIRGYVWMSFGVGFCGLLSVLSKENGVLIVLYVLLVEYVLLRPIDTNKPNGWNLWVSAFLFLPILMLLGWMIIKFPALESAYAIRDFTMSERLLTQSRIIVDYLANIITPSPERLGLFHDDYRVSRGLLDPSTTIICIIFLAALLLLAISTRRRAPVLCFAILWFFAGHLLESSFIALELYFEHRNYLPMLGPLMALSYYAVTAARHIRLVAVPALTTLVALMAVMTWQSAREWGNPVLLAEIWAEDHPTSPRAQQFSADLWFQLGRHEKAEQRIRHLTELRPRHTSAWAQLVMLHCLAGRDFDDYDFDTTIVALQRGRVDTATAPTFRILLEHRANGSCTSLSYERILQLLEVLVNNESFKKDGRVLAGLHYVKANVHIATRDLPNTVKHLQRAFAIQPRTKYALTEAFVLASGGLYDDALLATERARAADHNTIFKISINEPTIAALERRLVADIARIKTIVDESP